MSDSRDITTGWKIPTELYADQPYVVKTQDGAWLCVLTTGRGLEGEHGQHIVVSRSTDYGRSWSDLLDIEPADGPEASYAVSLVIPNGRIFLFYNHNTDNLREILADDPPFPGGVCNRVDSQGHFVFKYSDDNGFTWSDKRYDIPMRSMDIDRKNPYEGRIKYLWNVGQAFLHDGSAYVPLIKIGGLGEGFFKRTEGVLLRSPNLMTEPDPEKITWETLPDGDFGLRTPPGGGPIAEEQTYVVLSDGSFFCTYRTIDGHSCCAYSRDGGHTWSTPQYMAYADGRLMKHPRAATFPWKCSNGKYLYWFDNNGGKSYDDRNPAWLCGGIEADSPEGKIIQWSQPDIVLYHDDPYIRFSYPGFIEENGNYYLTETEKVKARVHEIPGKFVEGLWNQFTLSDRLIDDGLILDTRADEEQVAMPQLPSFCERDATAADARTKDLRQGVSIEVVVKFSSLEAGQVLLDNRDEEGKGFVLTTTEQRTVSIMINDGRSVCSWDCDRGVLEANKVHKLGLIVDGGPKIILFLVDGKLCDGGAQRQFGWGRFSPHLRSMEGGKMIRVAPNLHGEISRVRIYQRALRVSEIVWNERLI